MEWDKKRIDKPVKKEKSPLDSLGMVKKFKPTMLRRNMRANIFTPESYQKRNLAQVVLDAERRKAEVLTLIRWVAFI